MLAVNLTRKSLLYEVVGNVSFDLVFYRSSRSTSCFRVCQDIRDVLVHQQVSRHGLTSGIWPFKETVTCKLSISVEKERVVK